MVKDNLLLNFPITREDILAAEDVFGPNGAYDVHPDMKSRTGEIMSLGRGVAYDASLNNNNNNTKRSIEIEVVSTFDVLPQFIWKGCFLGAQGYGVKESIMYQDNTGGGLDYLKTMERDLASIAQGT